MNEKKKISTILANGTKVEYNVILTFKNHQNNKDYVIFIILYTEKSVLCRNIYIYFSER